MQQNDQLDRLESGTHITSVATTYVRRAATHGVVVDRNDPTAAAMLTMIVHEEIHFRWFVLPMSEKRTQTPI